MTRWYEISPEVTAGFLVVPVVVASLAVHPIPLADVASNAPSAWAHPEAVMPHPDHGPELDRVPGPPQGIVYAVVSTGALHGTFYRAGL
jgi:hypothetical protein